MSYRYVPAFAFATTILAACSSTAVEPPNDLGMCSDARMTQACDNWTPGDVALCYSVRPDVQPDSSCGWLPSNRFGAPDPKHTSDAGDSADWWCCEGGAS